MSAELIRRAAALIALGVVIVAGAAVVLGGGPTHTVSVTVPSADSVIEGQEVRAAGLKVGSVASMTPVDGGRAVRLGLEIGDEAWPLPRGSQVEIRFGGTISFDNRYILLTRAPGSRRPIPDGGTIPTKDATVPVEYDRLLETFNPRVRRDVKALLVNGGAASEQAAPDFRRSLREAPPALRQADAVTRDLIHDERALTTLVRSTDSVVEAVDTADPGLGRLVRGAAATFSAVAAEEEGLKSTLEVTPPTLAHTRATLRRADFTLGEAADLTDDLAPGVRELRRIAPPLNSLLRTVADVGPGARVVLRDVRRATPEINPLLARTTQLAPRISSVLGKSVTELKCLRPYTPEVAAFASVWGDFNSATDGKDKYVRANIQNIIPAAGNASPMSSGELAKTFPGLRFGFPRPPGAAAGQPWFLPECGIGVDTLNPFKDPEARP